MKKIMYLFAGVCFMASCSENKVDNATTAAPETKEATAPPVYAYPVKYTQWEIGNPDNIKPVIEFYYAFDHKDEGKIASIFADTVRLRIPTVRDEIMVANNQINQKLTANRNMYGETSNDILSAVSLHDLQRNEDWVMIITYNKWVNKDGKRDSVLYSDSWRLTKGKIDFLMSFYKLPTEEFVGKNDAAK